LGYKSGSGNTLFNNYSDDTVILLVFEIVLNIISQFISADFETVPSDADNLTITINDEQNDSIFSKLLTFQPDAWQDPGIVPAYSSLVSGLEEIQESLIAEDAIMRDIIDSIKGIALSINDRTLALIDFFDTSMRVSDYLRLLFQSEDSNSILKNLSDEQVALSKRATAALLGTSDSTFLANEQIVSQEQYTILNSLLREPSFDSTAGSNIKLLSIGLPSGMLNALQNQPFIINKDSSLATEIIDIVTIKIFKRDPEFADIIFEPMSFIFDISRFSEIQEPVYVNSPFNTNLVTSILLKDIKGRDAVDDDAQTFDQFKASPEYDLLTNKQKKSIFKNHAISDTLNTYLKLMTGINTSEFTFLSNPQLLASQKPDQDVKDLLDMTSVIPGAPADATGTDDTSTKEQKNQYKRLLNSLIFRSGHNKLRIEQPKLFERIFTVPIDPDEYIIDTVKTMATSKGRLALNNLGAASSIVEEISPTGNTIIKIKPRSKKEGNFEFSEFFAVVALGVDD
jgi:hypothetical protein